MQISMSLLQVIMSVLAFSLSVAVIAVVVRNNRWLRKQVTLIEKKCTDIEERRQISEDFTMELIDKVAKIEKSNGHVVVKQPRRRSKFNKKESV
jgi:hypothetical protein